MTLKILIGVAGVGKDTYVNKNKGKNDLVLSSDDIRIELYNSLKEGNKHNGEIFEEMRKRVKENINKYDNIYYNATNLSRKNRRGLYNEFKKYTDIETILILKPLDTIINQNNKRNGQRRVPEDKVRQMYLSLEVPRINVDTDKITVVGDYNDFIDEINENINKSHDNPYHKETIKEHIDKTIELSNTETLKEIAKYHDLGKSVARTKANITNDAKEFFLNNNGNYYQYMGHQKVSAIYYLLNNKEDINNNKYKQDVLEMILRHDDFINGISDKKIKLNNITEDMIKTLKEFLVIDKKSALRSEYFEEYIKLLKGKD